MDGSTALGTKQMIGGRLRVYYYGYWIKAYDVPANSLEQKKQLIEALTRRLFNHVEHGINVPGKRLDEARRAFELEQDPQRRRVKGAMLAGALFNRATDIFKKLVELQELGVVILPDNALMRECGEHLEEALALGKLVLHRSGEEGIDELWGEPLKAFSFPVEDFYKSRYTKIAQTMRAIDCICEELDATLGGMLMFTGIKALLFDFAQAAKLKSETLRTDPDIFDVWAEFVVASEKLTRFQPALPQRAEPTLSQWASQGTQLIHAGSALISYITRARVPMPKSTRELIGRCEQYRKTRGLSGARASSWQDATDLPSDRTHASH